MASCRNVRKTGYRELFFGGGKDHYKTLWTSKTLPHFNGFVFNKNLRARLAFRVQTKLLSPIGRYSAVDVHHNGKRDLQELEKWQMEGRWGLAEPGKRHRQKKRSARHNAFI